jgi:hypothetical protein
MAIKLYEWDATLLPEMVCPNKYDPSFQVKFYPDTLGYVSMTEGFAVLFNALNGNCLTKSDAAGVAAVKLGLKRDTDTLKVDSIRESYSMNDEFYALRTDNTAIKNDIAAKVLAVETARDAWLDVS